MDSIIEQLNTNLKIVYRQALDADKKLDELQQQGHGKFKALFGRKLIMTLKLSANTLWNRCCSRCRNLSTDGFSKEKLKNCRN